MAFWLTRISRSTRASRAKEVSHALKSPSATSVSTANEAPGASKANRLAKTSRPTREKKDASIAFLTLVPDEILLIVARYLVEPAHRQHIDALAALCLTGNHRLFNFFEPILYGLRGRGPNPCAMQWAAAKGRVYIMAKASANKVGIDSPDGTYQFQFRNNLGHPNLCYPVHPEALELAVMYGNIACIEYLLQNGANIHQETVAANLDISYNGNQRPQYRVLAWAIRYNQPQAIQFLLARGVGTLLSSHVPEFKPMHLAAVLGHEDLFEMLLAVPGCAIDDTDSRGHTPLHYASLGASALDCWGSPSETGDARLSSIRGLLQRGASTTSTNVTGATALKLSFRYHKDWDSQASLLLLAAEPLAFIASDRVISSAIICAQLPRNRDVFFRRLFAGRPVSRLYASGTDNLAMNSGWDLIPSASADFRVSLLIWSIVERDLMGSTLYTDTIASVTEQQKSVRRQAKILTSLGESEKTEILDAVPNLTRDMAAMSSTLGKVSKSQLVAADVEAAATRILELAQNAPAQTNTDPVSRVGAAAWGGIWRERKRVGGHAQSLLSSSGALSTGTTFGVVCEEPGKYHCAVAVAKWTKGHVAAWM